MVTGAFIENIPFVRISVLGKFLRDPVVVLDTGFTGDVQVTPKIAEELGLEIFGIANARVATGQKMQVYVALAIASMEGDTNPVRVIVSEGLPLIGISFLTKFNYRAVVDCKERSVILEK